MIKEIQSIMHMMFSYTNRISVICTSSKLEQELLIKLIEDQRPWVELTQLTCGRAILVSDDCGNTLRVVRNSTDYDLRGFSMNCILFTYKPSAELLDCIIPVMSATRGAVLYFNGHGKIQNLIKN